MAGAVRGPERRSRLTSADRKDDFAKRLVQRSLCGYHRPMDAWDRTRVTEVEALRAIAHPLRARLLGALRHEGPATATELGQRFGESSGSTSYHLRQLERYGFIVEDEDQPSKRERRWRAAAKLTSWDDADFVDQPEGREASDAMHDLQVHWLLKRDRQWRERRLESDRAWLGAAGTSDIEVRLTPGGDAPPHRALPRAGRRGRARVRRRTGRRDRLDPRPGGPRPSGRPRLMPATPAGLVRRFALLSALRWFPIGLDDPGQRPADAGARPRPGRDRRPVRHLRGRDDRPGAADRRPRRRGRAAHGPRRGLDRDDRVDARGRGRAGRPAGSRSRWCSARPGGPWVPGRSTPGTSTRPTRSTPRHRSGRAWRAARRPRRSRSGSGRSSAGSCRRSASRSGRRSRRARSSGSPCRSCSPPP